MKQLNLPNETKIRDDHTEETLKEELQELISDDIDDANMEEIQAKQEELGAFEEQKLFNILSKKTNFLLLDNEKIQVTARSQDSGWKPRPQPSTPPKHSKQRVFQSHWE